MPEKTIYRLSPMQQGMLFHSLAAPHSGIYLQQLCCRLRETLNVPAFIRAWDRVVERHAILRTSFSSDDQDGPQQQVHNAVNLSFEQHDYRALEKQAQTQKLDDYLQTDRRRGFDFNVAPLMRFALFRLEEDNYYLVWTFHHALMDGRSRLLVLTEVFAIYEALCDGREQSLPQPRPFSDFIAWLEQQDFSRAERFWREQLKGFTASTPLINSRSLGSSTELGEESVRLPAAFTTLLHSFAEQHELTVNTILQGAWALLLNQYSREPDVVFGITRAGRRNTIDGVDSMVGIFINTLPLRIAFSPQRSLLSLLKELRTLNVTRREYEHTPLTKIQEWSELPKGAPLFESLVVFENYHLNSLLRALWRNREFELIEKGNFPLTVLGYGGSELLLKIAYQQARFEQPQIARLLRDLESALKAIVTNPRQSVAEFSLVTDEERRQMLVEWNQTQVDYPEDTCIHQLFETQVERNPESIALTFADERITYRELNERASQLAHYLQSLGAGVETLVGIHLERSVETVVAILAVLKAGGAYVPLDPTYPASRLEMMIADSGLSLLLTREAMLGALALEKVVCLDRDAELIRQQPSSNPQSKVNAANLVYVIYTSGSTGRPKGVMIEHRGLCNLSAAQIKLFDIKPNSRVLQFASLSFDASASEIFTTLLAGATLCLAKQEQLILGQSLTQLLRDEEISVVTLPPSMLATLPINELRKLQTIVSAGEACSEEVAALCSASVARFINAYGPTEITVCATSAHCTDASQFMSIGRPIDNTQTYVLNAGLQPVSIGIPGELYIGGVGLARGYLNRPDLTAQKFIPNPFSDEPGARLYKTGDLARYTSDGRIEFLGRVDDQIKLRGFRIELGEPENVLRQCDGIRDAVVVARDNRLIAYVVPQSDRELDVHEVRTFLRQRLPEYMVPSVFVTLKSLPLSPNGKIDRRALPAPEQSVSDKTYEAPRTPLEQTIAKIWCEVLGVDRVGVNDDFFDLGGHSLLATQVVSRISKALEIEVPLRSALEETTVAGLAKSLETIPAGRQLTPIQRVSRDAELPLSFAQQRLWFFEQLQPDTSIYNVAQFLRFLGELDTTALQSALSEIVRRHEVLRTTYQQHGNLPVQIIHPPSPVPLPLTDLTSLPESDRRKEVQALAQWEAHRAFDLMKGPLLRAHLLRLDAREHVLLLTLHHIVSDAWSMGILLDELSAIYRGEESLPELPIQYADYASWQRDRLTGEVLEKQLDYWRRQLAEAPATLNLPTDYPRPATQSYRGAVSRFTLPATLVTSLRELSQQSGVTLFMTLLAAFKVLLYRYTNESDVIIGTPIAGRTRADTERLIGFFINTLVLRTRVNAEESFNGLLSRVREVCLDAYAHQEIPFEKLVEELQPQRTLSHAPLFQVLFSLLNTPEAELQIPKLEITRIGVERTTTKFDLSVSLVEHNDGEISGTFHYSTDLFGRDTIERMSRHWRRLLEGLVQDPQQRVGKLPLLTDEEHQLLARWNQNATRFADEPQCIHRIFERQVAERPTQTAVVCEDQAITYRELNERANQLAHYLQSLGAGVETLVGIHLERSVETVVAILAVLKAGGAYVPLDPTYPSARLEMMVADLPLVLTRGTLAFEKTTVVCLDRDAELIRQQPSSNPPSNVCEENLVYVIYTSGSTGKPKGVMIEHQQLFNYVNAVSQRLEFAAEAGFAMVSTFAADLGHTMFFPSLCFGGTLHIISQLRSMEGSALGEYFQQHRIDYVKIVPSHLRALLAPHPGRARIMPQRRLVLGGEAAGWDLIAEVEKLDPACGVVNHYGPTETTVGVLTHALEPNSQSESQTVALGHPLPNTQAYVLDAHLQPVPVRVPGELYIGGSGVARGYLSSPSLTAERFVPNPFSTAPGETLYRTGDLVRYLADGKIEFLGRRDHQIKIRGFRIELGEIETVLANHRDVRQAAVIVHEDHAGEKRLKAYIVQRSTAKVEVDKLRRYVKQHLPGYMVPSAFVVVEQLPMLSNGKLDRAALPAIESSEQKLESVAEEPRTWTEKVIAKIFAELLGLSRVGVNDDFFELGGHSLLATQAVSRIRELLMVALPLRDLFESPTVAQLAEAVKNYERKAGQTETIARLIIRTQTSTEESQ